MQHDVLILSILMHAVLPLWLAAGFADYLCHRAARIEMTSGVTESLLHLLLFVEIGVPMTLVLIFETNAAVFAVMVAGLVLHQATTLWDLAYAARTRRIGWIEQHVHGFLALLPPTALLLIALLHWDQFLALFGLGGEAADLAFRLKPYPLPWPFVVAALAAALALNLLPQIEELSRGLKARALNLRRDS